MPKQSFAHVFGVLLDTGAARGFGRLEGARFTMRGGATLLHTTVLADGRRHLAGALEGWWAQRPGDALTDSLLVSVNTGFAGISLMLGPDRGSGQRSGQASWRSDADSGEPRALDAVRWQATPCNTLATPDMGYRYQASAAP